MQALQHTLLVILVVIILTLIVSTFLSDERVSRKDWRRFGNYLLAPASRL